MKLRQERSLGRLPLAVLARRCAQETAVGNHRPANDGRYGFELLRRALADGSSAAFTAVHTIYTPQVTQWVSSHPQFAHTGESAEYVAAHALRAFYFALRGPAFARFASLPPLLRYLKLCVHTAIVHELRDQPAPRPLPLATTPALTDQPARDTRAAAELWHQLCALLPDERDQLLARLVFVQRLGPREIVAAFPAQWRDARAVSGALYRIRRTLRTDPALQTLGAAAELGSGLTDT
jgi:hypothetical protein